MARTASQLPFQLACEMNGDGRLDLMFCMPPNRMISHFLQGADGIATIGSLRCHGQLASAPFGVTLITTAYRRLLLRSVPQAASIDKYQTTSGEALFIPRMC